MKTKVRGQRTEAILTERRSCRRLHVEYDGYIEIKSLNNGIHYKPVKVVDLSLSGLQIIVLNDCQELVASIKQMISMWISFYIPSKSVLVQKCCKIVRFKTENFMSLGMAFFDKLEENVLQV